jgi:signal transduction histidine kinase
MAALGQLTAAVAHEINNPLGVIKSNADLGVRLVARLERSFNGHENTNQQNGHETRKYMQTLQESARSSVTASNRLSSLVLNLKRFTRVDEAAYQATDLHEGIDSALALLKPDLKPGVQIVKAFGDIPRIHSHPSELNQVFMTLLKNANEAIEEEGVITITTLKDDTNVYVHVADNGRGIPKEQLATLFEVGFSAKGSRMGMRAGLSNALHIIKHHNGQIEVESEPGRGTVFKIKLPIR